MKRTLLISLIIGASIVGFAFVVRHNADTSRQNQHKVDELAQVVQNQQEELAILRNATDPKKQAAALAAFFKALSIEIQKDLGKIDLSVQQTSPRVRTVVVTQTVCVRPNGRSC